MHVYLYYFVPDRPVTNSVPQGGVPVMPTGQELRFWGVDGQSPELISVTLQRTETNRRSLKYYSQHPGALQDHEPWLTAHSGISPICFSSSLTEAEEGDVSIKHRKNLLFVTLSYVLLLHRMNVFGGLAELARIPEWWVWSLRTVCPVGQSFWWCLSRSHRLSPQPLSVWDQTVLESAWKRFQMSWNS